MDISMYLVLVAFAASMVVAYFGIVAFQKWEVEYFSPREAWYFGLMMFLMGWIASSYLLGSDLLVFVAFLVMILVFALNIWKSRERRNNHLEITEARKIG